MFDIVSKLWPNAAVDNLPLLRAPYRIFVILGYICAVGWVYP